MNIYICGPVSERPRQEAVDHFIKVENQIHRRAKDSNLIINTSNPIRFCPSGLDWHASMRICVGELVMCDGIALLQDWQQSTGAKIELKLAEDLHIPVVYIEPPVETLKLSALFDIAPEATRYIYNHIIQFEKEGVEEIAAEERAMAELIHRYLDPHGFEYINISREE